MIVMSWGLYVKELRHSVYLGEMKQHKRDADLGAKFCSQVCMQESTSPAGGFFFFSFFFFKSRFAA